VLPTSLMGRSKKSRKINKFHVKSPIPMVYLGLMWEFDKLSLPYHGAFDINTLIGACFDTFSTPGAPYCSTYTFSSLFSKRPVHHIVLDTLTCIFCFNSVKFYQFNIKCNKVGIPLNSNYKPTIHTQLYKLHNCLLAAR